MLLENSSIKIKLLSAVIGSIVLFGIILIFETVSSLNHESEMIIEEAERSAYIAKEEELKNYVSLAYKTIENYHARTSKEKVKEEVQSYLKEQTNFLLSILEKEYEKNKNKLSEQELKNKLLEIMTSARYGKSGYFWINDLNSKMVAHPIKPSLNGKDLSKLKDKNGKQFFNEFVRVVKASNEGFVDYLWPKPGFEEPQTKVSYVKLFKPYGWVLGTGEYLDNVEEKMKAEALKVISEMKYGKNGYFWVNSSDYMMLAHGANEKLVGKNLKNLKGKKGALIFQEIVKVANASKDGGITKYYWKIPGKEGDYAKFSYVKKFEPWDFIVGTGSYVLEIEEEIAHMQHETEKNINSAITVTLTIVIVSLIIIATLIMFILKKVLFNPLEKFQNGLLDFFKYINKEKSDIEPITIEAKDEIGKMAEIINSNISKTKQNVENDNLLINDVKDVVSQVSEGYLDRRIKQSTSNKSLEELKELLNSMLENLEKLVGKNINAISNVLEQYANRNFTEKIDQDTSGKIGADIINMNRMLTYILRDNQKDGINLQSKSSELTTSVKTLNENATSQAASLEETAASIEQITGNIRQTSEKAQEMLNISSQTQNSANKGREYASKTATSMDDINETVISINEAITVIDQIAFQTNILSLNAAVEAATAGEAGKGFAVVAQEVRNLASRSAEAAKEIKDLVENATNKAAEGKEISSSMIEGFNELEDGIKHTNELIDDVTTSAKEQNLGMSQISDAINQLDEFTQENASIADRANIIAIETNEIAGKIVQNANENNFDGKEV